MERRKRKIKEDEWQSYFAYIRQECPWSGAAYQKGTLVITEWHKEVLPLDDLEGRVYVHHNASARQLKKLVGQLNRRSEIFEFLFSHPCYRHYSAPLPCIIQQDRAYLTLLRQKLNK